MSFGYESNSDQTLCETRKNDGYKDPGIVNVTLSTNLLRPIASGLQ